MPTDHVLLLFVGSALALLLTPGPAVLFIVTRSMQHGRSAGMVATLGLCAGGLVHVAAAVLGLSAVLASSQTAFTAVKLIGAGYLVFLGVKALRDRSSREWVETPPAALSRRRHFLDGFLVNLFNPKGAIFLLAFLPQFVDPSRGSPRFQLAMLGLTFMAMALLTDSAYALAAASGRAWLARNSRILRNVPYLSAAVYFGLGISAVLAGRRVQ